MLSGNHVLLSLKQELYCLKFNSPKMGHLNLKEFVPFSFESAAVHLNSFASVPYQKASINIYQNPIKAEETMSTTNWSPCSAPPQYIKLQTKSIKLDPDTIPFATYYKKILKIWAIKANHWSVKEKRACHSQLS